GASLRAAAAAAAATTAAAPASKAKRIRCAASRGSSSTIANSSSNRLSSRISLPSSASWMPRGHHVGRSRAPGRLALHQEIRQRPPAGSIPGAPCARAIELVLQGVEGAGIGVEDLVDDGRAQVALRLEGLERRDLGRRVVVAVVRADDDVVLACVLQHVGEVVVGLAGDPDAVVAQRRFAELPAAAGEAALEVVEHIEHPLGAQLDEAEAELGEAAGDIVPDERVELAHRGQLELAEARLVDEVVVYVEAAVARVRADRQVEAAGF